jgi:hypothetical protein
MLEENGNDKIRGMKLIIEAANEEDRETIMYLLDEKKFKKDYEKYINFKFLEHYYFTIKGETYNDIKKKLKIWKEGIKYNSSLCIDEITSYYSKWGECPDLKKEEKYHKLGIDLNVWGSYYYFIEKYDDNKDMKKVEKYINKYNEISQTISFDINNYLYKTYIATEDVQSKKKSIKYYKSLIEKSFINFFLIFIVGNKLKIIYLFRGYE